MKQSKSIVKIFKQWLNNEIPPREDLMMSMISQETLPLYGVSQTLIQKVYKERDDFIENYGYSVPTPEVIRALVKSGPVLDVCAGSGYWARLIENMGGTAVAVDDHSGGYDFKIGRWFDVQHLCGIQETRLKPKHTILMSWPDYATPFAHKVAANMSLGQNLFYVGEGHGGCTGDDGFHDYLDENFEEIEHYAIPKFRGIHDGVWHYRKITQRSHYVATSRS